MTQAKTFSREKCVFAIRIMDPANDVEFHVRGNDTGSSMPTCGVLFNQDDVHPCQAGPAISAVTQMDRTRISS